MKSSYRIFSVFGISVELHSTFVLFLLLLLFFAGAKSFLIILAWFFFVFAHEMSHSLVAKRSGVAVDKIYLTFFGGVANVAVPENPRLELKIALAGPLLNFSVVFVSLSLLWGLGFDVFDYGGLVSGGVGFDIGKILLSILYINLVLGLFNILPGFPMDGGRILRSVLALRMDYFKATRLAVGVGQYLIFPLMFLAGVWLGNVFLIFIPILLFFVSGNELRMLKLKGVFNKLSCGELARKDFVYVNKNTSIADFVDGVAEPNRRRYVVVDESGRVYGILDLRALSDARGRGVSGRVVGDYANPSFAVVEADAVVPDILGKILNSDFLLVVDSGRVVGYTSASLLFDSVPYFSVKSVLGRR